MNLKKLYPLFVFVLAIAFVLAACGPTPADVCGEGNVDHTVGDDVYCKTGASTTTTQQETTASNQSNVDVVDESIPAAAACRNQTWLNNAVGATNDVAALIAELDRDFQVNEGGEWSQPGFSVPANSVFWTDLFDNVKALPNGVGKVRVLENSGWGVYKTTVDYVIPPENGGGRFLRLCK